MSDNLIDVAPNPNPKPKNKFLRYLGGFASFSLLVVGPYLVLRNKSSVGNPTPIPQIIDGSSQQDSPPTSESTANTTTTIVWPNELAANTTTSAELYEENLPPETTEIVEWATDEPPVPPDYIPTTD